MRLGMKLWSGCWSCCNTARSLLHLCKRIHTSGELNARVPVAIVVQIVATLGVDRAVPLWGQPEDGHAADKTVNNVFLSDMATSLAQHGVSPGA